MTDEQAEAEEAEDGQAPPERQPYAADVEPPAYQWGYQAFDPPESLWPPAVSRWLLPAERPILATRAHPARLAGPAAAILAALVLAVWANVALYGAHHASTGNVRTVWMLFAAGAAWSVYRWLDWRASWLIITPRRVLSVSGIARRTLEQLPVTKLRDADMRQGIPGRVLGYATFEFSSIATGHSLQHVDYVPWPEDVHREITALITRPVIPS